MRNSSLVLWTALLASSSISAPAQASMPDAVGLGARWQALGGGSVARVDDGTAALVNPAGLAGANTRRLSLGGFGAQPRVAPLPQLAWDTNQDGVVDARDGGLDWQPTPPSIGAVDLSLAGPLLPWLGAGVTLTAPTANLIRFATFDPQLPTYIRWSNRTQRTHLAFGVAAQPIDGVRLGVAIDVLAQGVATARMTVDAVASGEDGTTTAVFDVHDIDLRVIPTWAPVLGAQFDLGSAHPALEPITIGVRYHAQVGLPLDVALDVQANANLDDFGDSEPYVAALVASADLALFDHYVPHQLDGGASLRLGPGLVLHGDVRWMDWRRLVLNVAQVERAELLVPLLGQVDGITDGNPYSATAKSTFGARVGGEGTVALPAPRGLDRASLSVRIGGMLDPTPLVSQTSASSMLDSDHRVFTAGLGLDVVPTSPRVGPLALDVTLQVHQLAPANLPRAVDPTTAGAPLRPGGLPIGGTFVALGAALRFEGLGAPAAAP